jgi:hypothetical protein
MPLFHFIQENELSAEIPFSVEFARLPEIQTDHFRVFPSLSMMSQFRFALELQRGFCCIVEVNIQNLQIRE